MKPQQSSTMRKILLTTIFVAFFLMCLPTKNFAQYLNLGKIENCTLFTVNGAVTSYGTSTYNGIIAADLGIVAGFDATSTSYTIHQNDAFTKQATIDVLNAYVLLNNVPVTDITHAAAFTGIITPGVYLIGGAGSISGDVILDGGGRDTAVFIFKFQGAFTADAASKIILTGGTRAANVFWIAEGAASTGTGCTMIGTIIAHPGAVTLGNGSSLEGRMLSTTGAVSFGSGNAKLPVGSSTIPIDCVVTCDNPILGTAVNFALFTSSGALSNTGASGVIGDVGTNGGGTVSGFDAATNTIVVGNTEYSNAVTQQAAADLLAGYNTLFAKAVTVHHGPAYGTGEILLPGVYATGAASTVSGTLTLDGNNDPNAEFVFKIGAKLSVAAHTRVILINKARRCNIFWIAEGAIDMATFTFMKGNVISHGGAISMGGQGFLEGRMFSTAGACSFNTATTYISNSLCAGSMDNRLRVLPIQLTSFTGNCYKQNIELKWNTATEVNNKNFSVERSNDGKSWQSVGNIAGAGNSAVLLNYSLVDNLASAYTTFFYRLKQTDVDNNFKYSKVISVTKCGASEEENLSISPNPSTGQFSFNFNGDKNLISSTEILNVQGLKVYQTNGFQAKVNLSNQAAGIYLVRVHLNSKTIIRRIVISK